MSENMQPHNDTPRKSYPHSGHGLVQKPVKEKIRADLNAVMKNKITIITQEKFLEEFVPEAQEKRPEETKDIFKPLKDFSTERSMYDPIIKALNDARLCPGFTFVSTPSKGDKKVETNEAVDGGLYRTKGAPKPTKSSGKGAPSCAVNWTTIEVCIECKTDSVSGDPFDESQPNKAPEAKERRKVLGQILAYAQLVYDNQQRTSQFMLLFLGTTARIVHIDRSGIFATKKFDYKEDATHLVEFIWRFARLDASKRGHDTTAERIAHGSEIGKAMKAMADRVSDDANLHDYAHVQFKKSLNRSAVWWCLTVKDEFATEDEKKERKFLVGQPHFNAPGVSGRGTRGYVALDYDELRAPAPKFVYLKDAWRVVHDDIEKEGDTLRALNDAKVRFVPTVLCHGDLGQITRSAALWVTHHPDVPPGTRCPLKKHSHYRLVVKEVGRPLEDFHNGEALVNAIFCCVTAHSDAYERGIIHRDISVGNMLIYTDEEGLESGLLNDWELSKHLDDHNPEGRQLDRTGTWEFMSVFALDDPKKRIVIQDELESFFHALLYMAIRFLPHNCKNVGALLYKYFEDYQECSNGDYRCGSAKKRAIKDGYVDLVDQGHEECDRLVFLLPGSIATHPINKLIDKLFSWFSAHYQLNKKVPQPLPNSITPNTSRVRPRLRFQALDDEGEMESLSEEEDFITPEEEDNTMTPEEEEKIRGLAQRLDTHKSFLSLLYAIGNPNSKSKWRYMDDKGPDKRPEGGYNPFPEAHTSQPLSGTTSAAVHVPSSLAKEASEDSDPDIPLAVTTGINLKRPSSDVDGLEPPSTPLKRVQRD